MKLKAVLELLKLNKQKQGINHTSILRNDNNEVELENQELFELRGGTQGFDRATNEGNEG